MEEKKVLLSIIGTQTNPDGQDQCIELMTEGSFSRRNDDYIVEFDESETIGEGQTHTRITMEKDCVSLEREGVQTAHFEFRHGIRCVNNYQTPFGNLEMGVFPTHIDVKVGDHGGELDLEYQLDIGGKYASLNQLYVNIGDESAHE